MRWRIESGAAEGVTNRVSNGVTHLRCAVLRICVKWIKVVVIKNYDDNRLFHRRDVCCANGTTFRKQNRPRISPEPGFSGPSRVDSPKLD